MNDQKPDSPTTTENVYDPIEPPAEDGVAEKAVTQPETTKEAALQLGDRALEFLSNASNETLGACLVGLGATTYFVLGRVGLVLIGVVGGVALHATWDGSRIGSVEDRAKLSTRRKETGIDVVNRILDWRAKSNEGDEHNKDGTADVKLAAGKQADYSSLRPETRKALDELTDAVVRDYVKWWYTPILPAETAFPGACRQTLTSFVLSISKHLSRKRPADTFLDFLTNSSSIVIVFLNELSGALTTNPSMSVTEAIATYLHARPDCHLAHVLDTNHQEKKLSMVADDVLQSYLDVRAYNCKPANVFLREILAKVVLEKTIQSCSTPEFINGWIVYLLEEGEPELLNVIDAGVEESTGDRLKIVTDKVKAHDEAVEKQNRSGGSTAEINHKRAVSRAQEAMDEAMREARRLTDMIAEEDAKRQRGLEPQATGTNHDDVSETTTQGMATPSSSQSDTNADVGRVEAGNPSIDTSRSASLDPPAENVPAQSSGFTSFDQLSLPTPDSGLNGDESPKEPQGPLPLTLFNANVSILDDMTPVDKGLIKTKPMVDYLIQIEPSSSQQPGWMIARKYADFETLHEIVRRISVISGVVGFTEAHGQLPNWKGHTKGSLRGELERYLNDAVRFRELAETEGMKRFLDKDQGLSQSPGKGGFPGIGWPSQNAFGNMGKGMVDVFTKAPREVAGGGKAIIGGVTGVFTGQKKNSSSTTSLTRPINPSPSSHTRTDSTLGALPYRESTDSLRTSSIIDTQPAPVPQMERRPSYNLETDDRKSRNPSQTRSSKANSRSASIGAGVDMSGMGGDQIIQLPPLPSNITDDYGQNGPPASLSRKHGSTTSLSRSYPSPLSPNQPSPFAGKRSLQDPTSPQADKPAQHKPKPPLSEQETQVAVELFFAMINELYNISSAWNIRKTLLTAAKTFLLRPGNPQLESIRVLLQDAMLDANTSDAGVASHILKLRENALPTESELKAWPAPMSDSDKEKLRRKARKLLVKHGMPQALTSVMGGAASGEALGKVFDCLQVEKVARGLMFGLLLQGLRAVTQ